MGSVIRWNVFRIRLSRFELLRQNCDIYNLQLNTTLDDWQARSEIHASITLYLPGHILYNNTVSCGECNASLDV